MQPDNNSTGETVSGQYIDLASSRRVPVLLETVKLLSRATNPLEVINAFMTAMRAAYGPRAYIAVTTQELPAGAYRVTRFSDYTGLERILNLPGATVRDLPVHHGGFIGHLIADGAPKLVHHLRVADDPVFGYQLREFGCAAAVPLFVDGRVADWAIVLDRTLTGFTVEDVEQFMLRANLLAAMINNTLANQQLRAASAYIHREVDQIASIQKSMLPAQMPTIPGVRLAASYATFDRAGGDYYDILPLKQSNSNGAVRPNGRWLILIADASGHGPSAAVVVGMVHTLVRACLIERSRPAEMLTYLNRQLVENAVNGSFVTAFLGVYEPQTRRLAYSRAGHHPPFIKQPGAGGAVRVLDEAGTLPLGLMDDLSVDEAEVVLQPGETLVLYTDGVVDEAGPDGTQFGVARLIDAIERCNGEAACIVKSVGEELRAHQSYTRPEDDQTLLAMQVI